MREEGEEGCGGTAPTPPPGLEADEGLGGALDSYMTQEQGRNGQYKGSKQGPHIHPNAPW